MSDLAGAAGPSWSDIGRVFYRFHGADALLLVGASLLLVQPATSPVGTSSGTMLSYNNLNIHLATNTVSLTTPWCLR